uniref:Uncharacterized protein n=1 Tax=Meloidogyne enterolobii TaxID=390850 RepID=A0A6V7WAV9_MELEN|nr:unnamed protein product [Meloidogyne enterolobii]
MLLPLLEVVVVALQQKEGVEVPVNATISNNKILYWPKLWVILHLHQFYNKIPVHKVEEGEGSLLGVEELIHHYLIHPPPPMYSSSLEKIGTPTIENASPVVAAAPSSSSSSEDQQKDYWVALFGAGGVGKSSLVQRFIKNTFTDVYSPTIEDTYQQVINCSDQGRLAVCTLHLVDTTGSHQFPAMQRLAMQRGKCFYSCLFNYFKTKFRRTWTYC